MPLSDLGLAFLEGLALTISPCILPVLPIILSAGIGDKAKPYGIILGFIIAFCSFTLFSRQLILFLHIDPEIFRQVSFAILILFGIVLISSTLSAKFNSLTQGFANTGERLSGGGNPRQGFWGGLLLGLPIGLIWTPCAGPIIAAVIIQTVRQQTNIGSILSLLAFSLGTGLPMLILATQGNRLVTKINFLKKNSEIIRKIMGAIIIITVLFTASGGLFFASAATESNATLPLQHAVDKPYPAPEISGISDWINSTPLTMTQLRGKVVLIDFWTYSCINCVRTLPYIIKWDQQYRDQGLVVIGVHSPEFPFEQKLENVQQAVLQHHIQYPVALDNQFETWSNFHNNYWPAHYLIDRNGNVVYTHFGEGDYDTTENNIRFLLGKPALAPIAATPAAAAGDDITPETYLGLARGQRFASPDPASHTYKFPNQLSLHQWALQGDWQRNDKNIVAESTGASIKLHFHAKQVILVLGAPHNQSIKVTLRLNGKPVSEKPLMVSLATLYELVNLPTVQDGTLEIIANAPGLEAYAFTFGS